MIFVVTDRSCGSLRVIYSMIGLHREATGPDGATTGVGKELSPKTMRNDGTAFQTQASSDQH